MTANGTALTERNNGTLSQGGSLGLIDHFRDADPVTLVEHFYNSGLFSDTKSMSQAIVKMAAGEELGLGPMASMQELHLIQGKPTLSARGIGALIKASGKYDYKVLRADAAACEIEWFKNGESIDVTSFTIEQAQRAGLAQKDNWRKTPEDMLFARTLSRGGRRNCPEVILGIYLPDEVIHGIAEDVTEPEIEAVPVEAAEPEAVDAEPVEDAQVVEDESTISKAEAGRIYDAAVAIDSLEPDKFAQAVGFVIEADPGDMSKKGKAVDVLAGMTEQQAERIKGWIEKKAGTGQEGEDNE